MYRNETGRRGPAQDPLAEMQVECGVASGAGIAHSPAERDRTPDFLK
jgi:hypothetical protein